jgi:cell division protease FtsH
MKFSTIALIGSFLMNNNVAAFTPASIARAAPRSSARFMAMEEAPATAAATNVPVIQSRGGAPVDVRYSDFLRLVNADKIEKVTFSSDGTQLLGVDTEGVRIKIEALPNDPDLLTQLTGHKVRFIQILR